MTLPKTAPRLDVVIPTRHRNDLLARCLERLAPGCQTLPADQYTVTITDDGSETTADAMIQAQFPWAIWVAGPKQGPAANRNNGARRGTAQWVLFTDDDCVPGAGWLQGFVDAEMADIAQSGKPFDIYEGRTTCEEGIKSPIHHSPVNEEGGWLLSCNFAIRRERFEELGGFDEEFPFAHMEDVDFRERARGLGMTMRFVPAAVVDHPPRVENLGEKIAPTHESEFMFYFKVGEKASFQMRLIRQLARVRIGKYLRHHKHPDAKLLLRSFFIEAAYILRHSKEWDRKYRNRYAGIQISYPTDIADRLHLR